MDNLFHSMGLYAFILLFLESSILVFGNYCDRTAPNTRASKTQGDNGFTIKIMGRPAPERYTPEQVYTISLNSTYPGQKFLGFYLVAVPENSEDESQTLGTLQLFNNPPVTKFNDYCPNIVTHTYSDLKNGMSVMWTAPPSGSGCVEFRATVIEYPDVWYKDDGALTKRFCEETGRGDGRQKELTPDCCACGVAKYHMVFAGNWSVLTHPKDFPQQTHLLHWSNIVGASHNKDYTVWQYGSLATKGVRDVCEFGHARTIEKEIREHGDDVRTVIKTPGIWRDLKQTRWARFTVNRTHHLLSLLSMFGPSPDWCVGVSGLDLCTPDCKWIKETKVELYPWDAGTDSGITYMSPNTVTNPQEKIHRITSTYPNNPRSPFNTGGPIKPMATLFIRRLHPWQDDQCVEDTLFDDQFTADNEYDISEMERRKLKMGKCAVTDWSDWSACSVTCGVGMRVRKRRLMRDDLPPGMCEVETMEKENCIGIENECDYSAKCSVSVWSDWSPCSVTCGQGTRERQRYFIRKEEMSQCQTETFQREQCFGLVDDCARAHTGRNFTAICSLPKLIGPCRGSFERWYFDTTMLKCLSFTYGGCRGNDNRFETQEICESMCAGAREVLANLGRPWLQNEASRGPRDESGTNPGIVTVNQNDCMITQWSDWSQCSRTCGRGYTTRTRMVKREAIGDGKPCPKKLENKMKCRIKKCPVDCRLGEWTQWTPCSQTCGDDVLQERTRPIERKNKFGGQACGPRLLRRYCTLPLCPGQSQRVSDSEKERRLTQIQDNLG